jgi:succinate-acetate transporter protein
MKGDLNKMETVLIILGIYATIMVYCAMMANWEIYRMMYPSDNNKKENK